MSEKLAGRLFVVATPIGNLSDITFRAIEILKSVDFIAAEDTRTSSVLLKHYGISKPMLSFHSYSGANRANEILRRISQGESGALITDAGTPGISDPGYTLVRDAVQAGVDVVPIPGPTAFVAALSASGLRTDRFIFEGFLPLKKGRQKKLQHLSTETRTIVFYESPHRIEKTLQELLKYFGDRRCVVGRELTKIHETFYRGSFSEVLKSINLSEKRGEFVIIVEGAED
ncbi:MAG: 16S rRNA (cytidine(1402)-2'-O)-methyltransferase [Bacteroidetes bacterium]|nr:16S rRNA (cytidine(1402)-2'-O)-methyltransferase [Bacteroidota bacterium]MCL5737699.1 16S rRNA (cytidine(1402)-2'-O)-methyltransferase [Bacteroidota bacterium]